MLLFVHGAPTNAVVFSWLINLVFQVPSNGVFFHHSAALFAVVLLYSCSSCFRFISYNNLFARLKHSPTWPHTVHHFLLIITTFHAIAPSRFVIAYTFVHSAALVAEFTVIYIEIVFVYKHCMFSFAFPYKCSVPPPASAFLFPLSVEMFRDCGVRDLYMCTDYRQ
jgi:hypothetical protein